MKFLFLPLLFLFSSASVSAKTSPREILKKACEASHLFEISKKKELSFQFNVRLPKKTVSRKWKWDIKAQKAYLNGKLQTNMAKFINDSYWLLFPLKAFNDKKSTSLQFIKGVKSPLGKVACNQLTVTYTGGKGYTPNDVYKLYLNEKHQIIEWAYLKGGSEPPKKITSWEGYKTIGGITFSLIRKSKRKFKVWFSNVSVK